MQIKGKSVLVTGANRGLGRALVDAFLAAGATVYAGARDTATLKDARARAVRLDITDPASVQAAAKALGDVSIVVNNAGIFAQGGAVASDSITVARDNMETNFYGTYNVANAFAPILAKNGGGAIVNVLSVLSWLTLEGTSGYSASKAAAWALSNGLRKELKEKNIQIVSVHVGYMDTDMVAGVTAPKSKPADIAAQILDAIEHDRAELIADDISRNVKASLGSGEAAYL